MKIHLKNTDTNEVKMNVSYPRISIAEPVVGLSENLLYYYTEEEEKTAYNPLTHKLVRTEAWTDETHPEYTHLKKHEVAWQKTQLSDEQIISNLNEELGRHLDEKYLLPVRIKHLKEGIELQLLGESRTTEQNKRLLYLVSIGDWMNSCRDVRDARQEALINEGTLPSFEFPEMPYQSFEDFKEQKP